MLKRFASLSNGQLMESLSISWWTYSTTSRP